MLASHGGDVELVKVTPPAVELRFIGACDGCPASALTFHAGVKKAVQDACPEITEIRQVKGARRGAEAASDFVSPFALGDEGSWRYAASLSDIPEGGVRRWSLTESACCFPGKAPSSPASRTPAPISGLPLDGGEIVDGVLTCPHHDFQYDLASGECLTAPEVQLQAHAVRVVGRRVEVRLSK